MHTPRTHKGFTLIELLVVIAIIGVLGAVVLASLNTARIRARNAGTVASVKEIAKGMEMYFADHGRYPQSVAWDCMGANSDDDCWTENNITYKYSGNHADMTAFKSYIDTDSIPSYTEGSGAESFLYYDRGGNGYELLYLLEGTSQDCPVGYNRSTNVDSSGNTSCTLCVNFSGNVHCQGDRF